ncbi:MAG: hypothetical protein JRG76_03470 [Deltaproteobacteria bacterium]|nr:hypothetical protein [Deltaproteobacteria bacterium]MBW2413550.1 hypothetical protein [Deltaproteobacteria bacterium]
MTGSRSMLALLLLLPGLARAIEPTTVTVEVAVVVTERNEGRVRDLVFRAALTEAVFQVVRLFASPEAIEYEEERVREALAPRAAGYVLTYTVDAGPRRRPTADDPEIEEVALTLTATVDAAQVRGQLRTLGLLRSSRDRPSVALLVVPASGSFGGARELLGAFERYLADRLRDEEFIVVEPALRSGTPRPQSALDLARAVGADLAVEVRVSWNERSLSPGMVAGVAEVRGRAYRAHDGFEVASSHFDAPGYHPSRDEAFIRAVEALEDQLAGNLLMQLDRNWTALSPDDAPVFLRLSNVSSYRQVEAVRRLMSDVLGARRAQVLSLGPRNAELVFQGPLRAGALQERLAAVAFEGFRLEPVEVRRDRVELRVARVEPAATAASPRR